MSVWLQEDLMDDLLKIMNDIHPEIDYAANESLIDGGVFDSFDIVTLIAEINGKMDITVPAEEIVPENFNSYKALRALLDKLDD
jgi:acyl carrier protein